jgi:hypothetical protein
MMGGFLLFAPLIGRGSDPLRSPEVIWSVVILALALLVGALNVYLTDRWRKGITARSSDAARELTEFRRMYEHGEITEEEYVKLRDKVAKRVKAQPAAQAPEASDQMNLPNAGLVPPIMLPGPDQPTPPPEPGKPANPSPPA